MVDKEQVKAAIAANPLGFYGRALPGATIKREGNKWTTLCPMHADTDPSLVFFPDGCWKCFGACQTGGDGLELLMRLDGLEFDAALLKAADIVGVATDGKRGKSGGNHTKRWDLTDALGNVVATHCRVDKADGKSVWWERNGKKSLSGLRVEDVPLYNLPALLAADPGAVVVVTEGEKDCDHLQAQGGVLTVGTACGAATLPADEQLRPLLEHDVVLWPDADEPGAKHMQEIGRRLIAMGAKPRLLSWPDAPSKGGAADFFLAGHDRTRLQAMIASAEPLEPEPEQARPLPLHAFGTDVAAYIGEVEWLWYPFIPMGEISLLVSKAGVGKSALALWLEYCAWSGCDWPNGQPGTGQASYVLHLEAEGFQGGYADRCNKWGIDASRQIWMGDKGMGTARLENPQFLDDVRRIVEEYGVKLVVLDALRRAHSGKENDSVLSNVIDPWQNLARDLKFAFLILHHLGKGYDGVSRPPTLDDVRGTSVIGDFIRSGIGLWTPDPQHKGIVQANHLKASVVPATVANDATFAFEWDEMGGLAFDVPMPERPPNDVEAAAAREFILRYVKLQGGRARRCDILTAAGDTYSRPSMDRAAKSLKKSGTLTTVTDAGVRYWALV